MSYTEEEGNFINFVHSITAAAVPEDSVKNKVCACVKNPHYRAPPELPLEIDSEVEARYGRKPACTICGLPPSNTEGFESFKVGKGNMTFWAKPKGIYGLLFSLYFCNYLYYYQIKFGVHAHDFFILLFFSKDARRII